MSRGPDAATLLERALLANAAAAGVSFTVSHWRSTPWASATYSGCRHELTLVANGAEVGAWLDRLSEAELPMRGHLVADVTPERRERRDGAMHVVLAALTLEEG